MLQESCGTCLVVVAALTNLAPQPIADSDRQRGVIPDSLYHLDDWNKIDSGAFGVPLLHQAKV